MNNELSKEPNKAPTGTDPKSIPCAAEGSIPIAKISIRIVKLIVAK